MIAEAVFKYKSVVASKIIHQSKVTWETEVFNTLPHLSIF